MFENKLAAQRLHPPALPTLYFEARVSRDRQSAMSIGMQASDGVLYIMKFVETGCVAHLSQTHMRPHTLFLYIAFSFFLSL